MTKEVPRTYVLRDEELIAYLRLQGLDKDIAAADRIELLATTNEQLVATNEALIEESGRRLALARSEGVARVEQFERTEALTEQLAAARQDAKEAEAYAEELEQELRDTQDRANAFATKEYYTEMRAERAEIKLAALLDAAEKVINSYWHSTDGVITGIYDLESALARVKGEIK